MESDFDAVLRIIRRCGWAVEIIAEHHEFIIKCKNVIMTFDSITGAMKNMEVIQ